APIADDPVVRQLHDLERLAAAHREGAGAPAAPPASDAVSGAVPEPRSSADLSGAAESPLGTWGQLRIMEKLGAGPFAEVFRAYDPSLQREVAPKLLYPR